MNIFIKAAEQLAEPANEAVNAVINKIGLGSIATTASIKAAEHNHVIAEGSIMTDWPATLAMIGTMLFIIKTTLDIVYGWQRRKAEKANQQAS